MAKAYKEGNGWAFRLRLKGQDIYQSDFKTEAEANKAVLINTAAILNQGKPTKKGPYQTTMGRALQDYALETLPRLKGAQQEAVRINRYLRQVKLDLLEVAKLVPSSQAESTSTSTTQDKAVYWSARLTRFEEKRSIAQGLGEHRDKQAARTIKSDKLRARLMNTKVAKITAHDIQLLMDTYSLDDYAPATVDKERSLLRGFFNYARKTWNWTAPIGNPAAGVTMPKIDNRRTRVLSDAEEIRLNKALHELKNPLFLPAVIFLSTTAMRASEAICTATWGDINWETNILKLRDAKWGKRDVPLSEIAIATLKGLPQGQPHEKIFNLTYEALKAGFQRACEKANIQDLVLHDLRHTAATRFALDHNGNIFYLQAFTGHKTLVCLQRYVHITAEHVVTAMRKVSSAKRDVSAPAPAPAHPQINLENAETAPTTTVPSNVVYASFSRSAA